jgi:glycosyltransferase involved in cell wall biosynthesis
MGVNLGRPKISVCIPSYNRARFLRQALESVFSQTLQDFEVIVVDDASGDDTREVVAAMGDPRVRYFRHARNRGIARSRNSCLEVARGQYLAWLDSDDRYLPEMLARQSAVLDCHPGVGLVHGAFEVFNQEGQRQPDWPAPFAGDQIEAAPAAFRELAHVNSINGATVLVRRACYERVGTYSTRLGQSSEDWEMWLRIALCFDVGYTAAALAKYRLHDASSSAASIASGLRLRNDIAVIRRIWSKHAGQIPDAGRLRRSAEAALAVRALLHAGDLFTKGRLLASFLALLHAPLADPSLVRRADVWRLLLSLVRNDEYAHYRCTKALLRHLYEVVADTRLGGQIKKMALASPQWEETLGQIAAVVRQVVPHDQRIAAVDKHDPTLLHLSQRRGWHFPDQRLLAGGYPADSGAAVTHLEELRRLGAGYLVLPSASFWWLDAYTGLRQHLHENCQRVWLDENCMIFRLERASES